MLEACSRLVRRGGTLCLITCSLEAEENELVVQPFLATNDDFEVLPLAGRLPDSMRQGESSGGRWRVLPTSLHDGFTVHALRRRADD